MSVHQQSIVQFASASQTGSFNSLRRAFQRIGSKLENWLDKRHQRRMLSQLDDHMLKDIGISRVDAIRESQKAFWK
jgi:uncharacterized protein YjiS (DUF1127 family)